MKVAVACVALVLAGCIPVTINVTFTQDKIENAASSIEDLVGSGAPPKSAPRPAPKSGPDVDSRRSVPDASWSAGLERAAISLLPAGAWLAPSAAEAQGVPELKIRTPEAMAAIESRRRRAPEIDATEAKGCLGETALGLVEARPGQGCPPTLRQIIAAENADRMFLYRTLVEQNNMPKEDLTRVQAAFGKTRRERAVPGTWIQMENGQWTRK